MLVGVRVSAVGKVGHMSWWAGGWFFSLLFHFLIDFVAAAELDLLTEWCTVCGGMLKVLNYSTRKAMNIITIHHMR